MAQKLRNYFYTAQIYRDNQVVTRQGNLHAKYPFDALDAIVEMATHQWKRKLKCIELYDLEERPMQLVATTSFKENTDGQTGRITQLGSSSSKSTTDTVKSGLPAVVGAPSHGVKTNRSPVNEDWKFSGTDIGSVWKKPTYATLKIGD